jgi:hypothetical protein
VAIFRGNEKLTGISQAPAAGWLTPYEIVLVIVSDLLLAVFAVWKSQDSYPISRYLESTIVPTTRPCHFAVLHVIWHTTLVYGRMATDTLRMESPQVLHQLDTIQHLRDN